MYYQPDDAWTLLFGNLGHVVVDDNQKIRCTIRPVKVPMAESITLSETSFTWGAGSSFYLSVKYNITPISAWHEPVWASSDESVATFRDGRVNCLRVGTCTIYAKTTDGSNLTAGFELNVVDWGE